MSLFSAYTCVCTRGWWVATQLPICLLLGVTSQKSLSKNHTPCVFLTGLVQVSGDRLPKQLYKLQCLYMQSTRRQLWQIIMLPCWLERFLWCFLKPTKAWCSKMHNSTWWAVQTGMQEILWSYVLAFKWGLAGVGVCDTTMHQHTWKHVCAHKSHRLYLTKTQSHTHSLQGH